MKNLFLAAYFIALLLTARHAHAQIAPSKTTHSSSRPLFFYQTDPSLFEAKATPTPINPKIAAVNAAVMKKVEQAGTWGFKFALIRPSGKSELLSHYRTDELMKPASILKLFTGWMAFNEHLASEKFLGKVLKKSLNPQADRIVNDFGGAERMIEYYRNTGLTEIDSSLRAVDGSGESDSNLMTVNMMDQLLIDIRKNKGYSKFKKLLAQPGADIGSLRIRLLSLKNRAFLKTGTMDDTVSLAGFVELKTGTLVFTIIGNDLQRDEKWGADYRATVDAIVIKYANLANRL